MSCRTLEVKQPQLTKVSSTSGAMDSEEMETKLVQLCDASRIHPALGRRPADVSRQIQVVSLGSSCGTKMTIRRLGLDGASMPFDWIRTSAAGVNNFLCDGFESYFRSPFTRTELTLNDLPMTVYRSTTHAFWHDNIEELETRQKLYRRVERFSGLGNEDKGRALLFVRSICGTQELLESDLMYELLQQRFGTQGRQVFLLVIIDDQGLVGPILHSKLKNLIFWVKPLTQGPLKIEGEGPGPYEDAVAFACRRILHDPEALMPNGHPGNGQWPIVTHSSEILQLGGILRNQFGSQLRDSEVGLWCGMVQRKDAIEPIMFCALEGYSERENQLALPQSLLCR